MVSIGGLIALIMFPSSISSAVFILEQKFTPQSILLIDWFNIASVWFKGALSESTAPKAYNLV